MSDNSVFSVRKWRGATPTSGTKRALILPGAHYRADNPVLSLACSVLTQCDYDVWALDWIFPDDLKLADSQSFIDSAADYVLAYAQDHEEKAPSQTLVVTKSIACFAAEWAKRHGFRGAWITPVLTIEPIVNALKAMRGEQYIAGGTADQFWDSAVAHRIGEPMVEVEGAAHSLEIPGNWRASLTSFEKVLAGLESFARS